jgi:hypothetical protein
LCLGLLVGCAGCDRLCGMDWLFNGLMACFLRRNNRKVTFRLLFLCGSFAH